LDKSNHNLSLSYENFILLNFLSIVILITIIEILILMKNTVITFEFTNFYNNLLIMLTLSDYQFVNIINYANLYFFINYLISFISKKVFIN
jgi:hypothetical protein